MYVSLYVYIDPLQLPSSVYCYSNCVCLYVCMYVCRFLVHMYVHTDVCIRTCMQGSYACITSSAKSIFMYVHTCIYIHIHIHVFMYTYTHTYVCTWVHHMCSYICMCIFAHYIHNVLYRERCFYVYTCSCIPVYMPHP